MTPLTKNLKEAWLILERGIGVRNVDLEVLLGAENLTFV